MATIGLRDLYRAPITVDESGKETYGTPVRMAKAISAEMSVEVAEAILYADDGADEVVKEFVSGELTLNVNDLMPADLAALLGQTQDADNVVYAGENDDPRIWQSASARRRPTACINIFGFTKSSLLSLPRATPRRAIALNSPRRRSRGSSSNAPMGFGRLNTSRFPRRARQRAGSRRFVNRTTQRANEKMKRRNGEAL